MEKLHVANNITTGSAKRKRRSSSVVRASFLATCDRKSYRNKKRWKLRTKEKPFMCSGSGSDPESSSNGWSRARGLVVKSLVLIGGALLLKRLTKSTTRRDHARLVSRSLTGEKVYSQFQCLNSLRFPDLSFCVLARSLSLI